MDFKTKDHLCLFLDLLSFEFLSKMIYRAPQCWAWAVSLCFCFCFLHLILSIIALVFFFFSKFLDPFDFSSCPLALFGHFWWLRNFFYAPQYCLGTFNRWGFFFFMFSHLPANVGCDPSQGYFQKTLPSSKGDCKGYSFSFVKGLSKMTFLHLKCMHLGSVSLAFMRVCNVISHYSFN